MSTQYLLIYSSALYIEMKAANKNKKYSPCFWEKTISISYKIFFLYGDSFFNYVTHLL